MKINSLHPNDKPVQPRSGPVRAELIELLNETNAAGDRALDWEIHLRNGLEGVGAYGCHPHYTTSLDEAVKLCQGMRGLTLMQRSNPDMGGRDWLVSAGSSRAAARSWPVALCILGLRKGR